MKHAQLPEKRENLLRRYKILFELTEDKNPLGVDRPEVLELLLE